MTTSLTNMEQHNKSPLCSEMSRLCLSELNMNNLQEDASTHLKDTHQEEGVEAKKTSHSEGDENTDKENYPPIKKYISVRKELFDESFAEEWVFLNPVCQPDISFCIECSLAFNDDWELYLHYMHHENHRCPISMCGRSFTTKTELGQHIDTHFINKSHNRGQCNRSIANSFARRGQLMAYKENMRSG